MVAWKAELRAVCVPLHHVQLASPIVSGKFQTAVRPQLEADFIVGNDSGGWGGKVYPSSEIIIDPCVVILILSDPEIFRCGGSQRHFYERSQSISPNHHSQL